MGAEDNVGPGLYQLNINKSEDITVDETYAQLVPLSVNVVPSKCTIKQDSQYDVEAGGYSLPI